MQSRVFGYFLCSKADMPAAAARLSAIYRYLGDHPELPAEVYANFDSTALDREPLGSRPNGRLLLHHLRRGDHLVLTSIDELGESAKCWSRRIESLWRQSVTMHFLDADPPIVIDRTVDKATKERLGAQIDQAVAEAKSRRTCETLKQRRNARKPYSHRPPFGFCVLQMPTGPVLAACKHERRWAAMIVRWRSEGLTWPQVHAELTRRRAKTNQGKPWSLRRVKRFAEFLRRERPGWAGMQVEPVLPEATVDVPGQACMDELATRGSLGNSAL